jgi:hypothetical protein
MTTEKLKATKQFALDGIGKDTRIPSKGLTGKLQQVGRAKAGLVVGGRWKIQGDGDLNIVLWKLGGKSWHSEGYFMTLAAALRYLVDAEVRQSDLSDLKATVERIEAIKREIVGIAAG